YLALGGRFANRPDSFYATIPSSTARRKNFGLTNTSTAGINVHEAKKLTAIHNARSNPISEQKRILEKAHRVVDITRVTAVNATASPAVASPKRTASVTSPLYSSTARLTM